MCGIAGLLKIDQTPVKNAGAKALAMGELIAHRGPDGDGLWTHPKGFAAFAHKRLSIIDLESGSQPMSDHLGRTVCYNGEIYNYRELKAELSDYPFKTTSDTEVILAAYDRWGFDCVKKFRGMFAFVIWDEKTGQMFVARDHVGIKPFYYTIQDGVFYFCSEAKGVLPALPSVEPDPVALKDYLHFQLYLSSRTLFKGVSQLMPGHAMLFSRGETKTWQYWEVHYDLDFNHTARYFKEKLREMVEHSVSLHMRADVPVGAYISGGIDSSAVAALARRETDREFLGFTGKFAQYGQSYDESLYALDVADKHGIKVHQRDITSEDFRNSIGKVIYHLDYPVAGPGAFAQYCISETASQHRKVVLGGQGGDEIFGGYTRYLIAYFEQCMKGAIDGTLNNGNFVVTYHSIIDQLQSLKTYKPMIKEFFRDGLFDSIDQRYYRLINRAPDLGDEVNWDEFGDYEPFEDFQKIFNGNNVGRESYFDKMTHFDFKTLLPALLQVEDRMSMAWGLESRVPLIEPELVEFAATMPADVKFKDGVLKKVFVKSIQDVLPQSILERKNKMGFPVPLNTWLKTDLKGFVHEVFGQKNSLQRRYVDNGQVIAKISGEKEFGRTIWGLMSLEIWHQQFVDRAGEFKSIFDKLN